MVESLLQYLNWIPNLATGVWLVLTGILIYTLLEINKKLDMKQPVFKAGVVLVVLIWLYPLYTRLFYPIEAGFIGNIITLLATFYYYKKLSQSIGHLRVWLWPQLIWISIASFFTLLLLIHKYAQ